MPVAKKKTATTKKPVAAPPPPPAPVIAPPPVAPPPFTPVAPTMRPDLAKGTVTFTHDQMDDIIVRLGEAEKMFLGALPIAALPMITRIRDMFKEKRKGL
jgi:hypothetical protein